MDEKPETQRVPVPAEGSDMKGMIREVIREFVANEHQANAPAHKAELHEERRRREQLEKRVNELVEENRKSRRVAEEADRHSQIRSELQRLGVAKIDLAFRVVKDEIVRAEDGSLIGRTGEGTVGAKEFLTTFVNENPEFMPARMSGGSGVTAPRGQAPVSPMLDLNKIRPGMSPEDLQRVREQISQVALQTLRGE